MTKNRLKRERILVLAQHLLCSFKCFLSIFVFFRSISARFPLTTHPTQHFPLYCQSNSLHFLLDFLPFTQFVHSSRSFPDDFHHFPLDFQLFYSQSFHFHHFSLVNFPHFPFDFQCFPLSLFISSVENYENRLGK
jgi:hypothetical protein